MNANENAQKCLAFIQKEMGVNLVEKDSYLSIEIINPRISYEELSKQVTALSKAYGKIEIIFTPKESDSLPVIEKFLESHGQSIRLLNLGKLKNRVDDRFIQTNIKYCPNLYQIFIESNIITSEGLEKLSDLQSLTELNLSGCRGLTKLPENLPAGLTSLNLYGCYGLTRLPDNLPAGLTSLNLYGCRGLTKLPDNLPAGLISLNLSYCRLNKAAG